MASRRIIACLFKTASFDQMRSHLIAIEGRTPRAIDKINPSTAARAKRTAAPTSDVVEELRRQFLEPSTRTAPWLSNTDPKLKETSRYSTAHPDRNRHAADRVLPESSLRKSLVDG
jgi:hypothetical protein